MSYWFRLPLRTRLGIIAGGLLLAAGASMMWATQDPLHHKPVYALIKFAPIVFLLWLAWYDLQNIPIWVYLITPPILILCALRPRALIVIVPLALFVLFVMPKKKPKS